MAILTKGQTFADADSVTSTKLNNLVDAAAFVAGSSGSTDDTSLEVNGSGQLQIKDLGVSSAKLASSSVTTSKLPNSTTAADGVTYAKLQRVASMRVIGNITGGLAAASEVSILDQDTMSSDSATAIPTQQSTKAYVDNTVNTYALNYDNTTIFTGSIPTTFTDLDLSSVVGATRVMAYLLVAPDVTSSRIMFKQKGITGDIGADPNGSPTGTSGMDTAITGIGYLIVPTNTAGVVQWKGNTAGSGGTTVKVVAFQKMS